VGSLTGNTNVQIKVLARMCKGSRPDESCLYLD